MPELSEMHLILPATNNVLVAVFNEKNKEVQRYLRGDLPGCLSR